LDKIMVEIYVPIIGKAYDVYLPPELMVVEVAERVRNAIFRLNPEEEYRLEGAGFAMLCRRDNGARLRAKQSVRECMENGTKLLLF
jgi:hypothetical protein